MDDTAQNSPSQTPSAPSGQTPVVQQPVRPVATPQVTGGHPEAPMSTGLPPREAAPVDEAEAVTTTSDDQAAMPDEVADASDVQRKEAADIKIEAQPQVEIAPELQRAGVEQGKDAESSQREEEQLKTESLVQPDTQASASGISIKSDPLQLEEVEKKNGIRNAIRWLAAAIVRQLKKMQMKPEDQKSTW